MFYYAWLSLHDLITEQLINNGWYEERFYDIGEQADQPSNQTLVPLTSVS